MPAASPGEPALLLLRERSKAEPRRSGVGSHPRSCGIGVAPSLSPPSAEGVCSSPPCAAFAPQGSATQGWMHQRIHPTALGMDLFKTLETPKSHPSAAFRAHSLGIKMMGCRCLDAAAPPGQAKDVTQQGNG